MYKTAINTLFELYYANFLSNYNILPVNKMSFPKENFLKDI